MKIFMRMMSVDYKLQFKMCTRYASIKRWVAQSLSMNGEGLARCAGARLYLDATGRVMSWH
jgi:hypothetical protein